MELNAFCSMMERIAPRSLAMEGDRIGLLIGTDHPDIRKVLVALDLTVDVADEAIRENADLVLTHHPIFWTPVTGIYPNRPDTAAAYRLIRHGIGHFAAHTNLDAAEGGVNDTLSAILGLEEIQALEPEGIGRVGCLPHEMCFADFVRKCENSLRTKARIVGDPKRLIRKVGCIGGSGGGDVQYAIQAGCDAFVTGEMKHNQAIDADYLGLCCCVLGHYETENPVLKHLISRLQSEHNDVQYTLTQTGRAPLPCFEGGNRNE